MTKIAEAFVEITARTAKLQAKLNGARAMVTKAVGRMAAGMRKGMAAIGRVVQRTFSTILKWIKRVTLAMTALAVFVAFKSVKAWGAQERAVRELAGALKGVGKFSDDALDRLKAFAGELQKVSTFGDETIISVMALGASLSGLAGKELEDTTVAAIGLSRKIGVDLRTAMMLLARAVGGQFQLFTRYGISLDETATAQEKLAKVFKVANEGLKIEEELVKSQSGAWERFKNQLGDVFEQLGRIVTTSGEGGSLSDGLERITTKIGELVEKLEDIPGKAGEFARTMVTAFVDVRIAVAKALADIELFIIRLQEIAAESKATGGGILEALGLRGQTIRGRGGTTFTLPGGGAEKGRKVFAKQLVEFEKRRLAIQEHIVKLERSKEGMVASGMKAVESVFGGGAVGALGGKQGKAPPGQGKAATPRATKALIDSLQTALGAFKFGQKSAQERLLTQQVNAQERTIGAIETLTDKVGSDDGAFF